MKINTINWNNEIKVIFNKIWIKLQILYKKGRKKLYELYIALGKWLLYVLETTLDRSYRWKNFVSRIKEKYGIKGYPYPIDYEIMKFFNNVIDIYLVLGFLLWIWPFLSAFLVLIIYNNNLIPILNKKVSFEYFYFFSLFINVVLILYVSKRDSDLEYEYKEEYTTNYDSFSYLRSRIKDRVEKRKRYKEFLKEWKVIKRRLKIIRKIILKQKQLSKIHKDYTY